MVIRPETPYDHPAIAAINRAAFAGTEEALLIDRLRAAGQVIVSLVAVASTQQIGGHVLFSPATIQAATHRCRWQRWRHSRCRRLINVQE